MTAVASKTYALDMFQQFYKNSKDDNLVFSPLSLQYLMGVLAMGADDSTVDNIVSAWHLGSTPSEQIHTYLGNTITQYKNISDEFGTVHIANGVFVSRQKNINPHFQAQAKANYCANIENIDTQSPQSVALINNWVNIQTCERIPEILNQNTNLPLADTSLINTIYFKGGWFEDGFSSEQTSNRTFYGVTKNEPVATMQKNGVGTYYEDERLQAVYLSYENTRFGFLILLPQQDGIKGLDSLTQHLDADYFTHILHHTQQPEINYSGMLYFPRFDVNYTNTSILGMSQELLGVDLQAAQFPHVLITPDPVQIDQIIHIANISVDENGTEAAAVSGGSLRLKCTGTVEPPKSFVMDVNHPFAYALVDREGQILFCGAVKDL